MRRPFSSTPLQKALGLPRFRSPKSQALASLLPSASKQRRTCSSENWAWLARISFSSRNSDFVQGILDATGGAGVDVVFSSLTGDLLHASWEVRGDCGRFVDISKRDSLDGSRLDMRPFSRSVTYLSCV
jgi:NADPH:quinone reductase-like Zn-dependent oxidoreductase